MRFDPGTFFLACGTLYLVLPVMVWLLLQRRHPALNIALWCVSGVAFAATLLLYGLRGQVSEVLSVWLANVLSFVAGSLQIAALRLEAPRPARAAWLLLGCVVAASVTWLLLHAESWLRQGGINLMQAVLTAVLTWSAWQLGQARRSRSMRVMSVVFGLTSLSLTVRSLLYLSGHVTTPALQADGPFLVAVVMTLVAAVSGNMGFVGLALDSARATARDRQSALLALHEQQQAMETASQTRKAVAGERARTTRLLAHEVRQPLHNASVALQAALATLARSQDRDEAAQAVRQAQAVIRRVSATLDNTVAATTLLAGHDRISTADTDLQMLIDLSIGDLAPEARRRVHVDYAADARSATLEATLVRLALRNLLANATLYAPDESPVTLRVLDSDQPLALVLEVADEGPGIPDALRESIFEEGVRGQQATVPGYGLGLHVVQRVARLHGGSIEWLPNHPQGSVFRLTLPQTDPG